MEYTKELIEEVIEGVIEEVISKADAFIAGDFAAQINNPSEFDVIYIALKNSGIMDCKLFINKVDLLNFLKGSFFVLNNDIKIIICERDFIKKGNFLIIAEEKYIYGNFLTCKIALTFD